MDQLEAARLVEFSEARAYRSLVDSGKPDLEPFSSADFGAAVAVFSDSVTSSLNLNRVIGLGIEEPVTIDQIDRVCALYEAHGVPFGVELSPAAMPVETAHWLRHRRIRRGFDTAVHYCEARAPVESRCDLRIERTGEEHSEQLARICCTNFRMPDAVRPLLMATIDRPGWRHWLAFDGEVPVAATLSFVAEGCCWIGWTSTNATHRGRGAHTALYVAAMCGALADGCRWITTETAVGRRDDPDPARRNLKRMGFTEAYLRPTYVAAPRKR